jgi:hypothetical protein
VSDPLRIMTRVLGATAVVGIGAEVRLTEESLVDGSIVDLSGPIPLADTAGTWAAFRFKNGIAAPRMGDFAYRLEGRLGAATSAKVRYVSGALIEVVFAS